MTRRNRHTADIDYARALRAEALATLRGALFVDAEQAAVFSDVEVITLARVRYRDTSQLETALDHADWAGLAADAEFRAALQAGLQLLDVAAHAA